MDRREFVKNGFRNLLLGSLGIMSGVLVLRSLNDEEESCDFNFLCRNCKQLKGCTLPQGLDFKKQAQ